MASGRRTSLASLAGARVETVPGQTEPILVRLTLDKVTPTPLNPRTNFGTADDLTELGESMRRRQLQPVVVISRASYLRLFPEHQEQAGTAAYIIITGERRYRGARQVGLPTLGAVILEEIAASRQDIIDAVLSENIDRKNFDPIEEALAVQVMVRECGKAAAAAERFGRSGGWISQRLALLRLAPEVQGMVRSGTIPVRDARELVAFPLDEQLVVWRGRVEERQARRTQTPKPALAASLVPPAGIAAGSDAPTMRESDQVTVTTHSAAAPAGERVASERPPSMVGGPAGDPVCPAQPVGGPVSSPGAGSVRPRVVEPEWAVGDTSAPLAAARSLVEQFGPAERRLIVRYLRQVELVSADS